MLKDKMIRVRLYKSYHEQRPLSFVGKCVVFNDCWVAVTGRVIMVTRSSKTGVQIDDKLSQHVIPRDSIESIRVLPDDFDINAITVTTEGQQLVIPVKGAQPCFIGEIGEG
ncbi:MAG: hypothetical protein BWY09_01680 [Candidatus Hydrogenedentes bacterium ADurb.Bin179]|nr:MAG: hypothetical protein BWY09_01680 [Candidatus Hydrogenedentes bacterium ADurb.Bin179]